MDLQAKADSLGEVTPFDRLMTGTIDVISAVPVAGPIVAAVARQLLPSDALIYCGTSRLRLPRGSSA